MTAVRVLVVDDNAINIDLAAFVLRAQGFAVESTCNADEAVVRAVSWRPDVILMDIQMPEVDGIEAVRRLRQDPATRDVVVIAFTAYAMKGDEQKMRAAGCDGYIAKPIDIATFGQSVRACLDARRAATGGGVGPTRLPAA
jgi:two-component system, cell cycle response regulator DivK